MDLRPDLGHFAWIWAIIIGFGSSCMKLGRNACICAILQNLDLNRPQRRRSLEDGVEGQTDR